MMNGMARARATAKSPTNGHTPRGGRVRIQEECLELNVGTARDAMVLRGWIGRVNGASYAQPYLVEGPPGRFRLYVGTAAERARTEHGII